jgi:hypothetical protein
VLKFVQGLLLEGGETDLGNIAEEALDTCLERKSSDNDDDDHWSSRPQRSNRCNRCVTNAVWGQRSSRKARLYRQQADKTTRDVTFRGLRFYFNVFLQCVDEMNMIQSIETY